MAFIWHHDHAIVEGKPLQDILQGTHANYAQALVFTPDPLSLCERTTSVVVGFYTHCCNEDVTFYCWHEDKEELMSDDIHITYQKDYQDELVNELQARYQLDVNAPIWYEWPGDIPPAHVCWHCGALYEIGSAKDDLFCSDACYDAH